MTFLHPWAIAIGAVAAAAPVIIHLLTRPRPVRMPLSTLRFVREAVQQRRARHWLRDLIILALRTAAVALIAMAVARPLLGPQPLVSDRQTGDSVRVVLIDVSQSNAATVEAVQQTEIDRAKTEAANRYLRYRPGLWANLILAGAVPRAVFDSPSTNFEALRDELSRCEALPERLDVKAALEKAAQMLAPTSESDTRRRELVVLSDFQRSSWAGADFSVLPEGTRIQIESTASAEPPANLAVLRTAARAHGAAGGGVLVEVEVGNFTPTARKVTVEVSLGQFQRRLEGVCPAQGRLTLMDEIETREPGWLWGEARLVGTGDCLPADDVRPLVVQVRQRPTYALLTREPAHRRPSSSHFLECALVPDGRLGDRASAALVRIDPAALELKTINASDLVCLDHPGKLSDDAVRAIAGVLRRGQPVFYVAGETTDATNLKRLVELSGAGLQMPVEFQPPPTGHARRGLFLKTVRAEESPFAAFGDGLSAVRDKLRFGGGLASRPTTRGVADDVLATYNDGSACLVCTTADAGMLAVLNADLAASNLPEKQAFVPLIKDLVQRLIERGGGSAVACCGERLVAQLPGDVPAAAGLRVVAPPGTKQDASGRGELVEEGAAVVWRWSTPDRPGAYRVCPDKGEQTVFAQAIEIPAEESQLDSLPKDVLEGRLAAGHQIFYRQVDAEDDRRDDLWRWAALACVVCLLGEVTSLIAFKT